jgi:hypothetical protein
MAPTNVEKHNDQALLRSIGLFWLYVGSIVAGVSMIGGSLIWIDFLGLPRDVKNTILLAVLIGSYLFTTFFTMSAFCMARTKLNFRAVWRESLVASLLTILTIPVVIILGGLVLLGIGSLWTESELFLTSLSTTPVLVVLWWVFTRSIYWKSFIAEWNVLTKIALFLLQLFICYAYISGIFIVLS